MPVTAQSILEVQVHYEVSSQKCRNVLHYKYIDSFDLTISAKDIQESFLTTNVGGGGATKLDTAFAALMASNVTVTEVTAQIIYPTRYLISRKTAGLVGANAGVCTAQNVAGVIQKSGPEGNRHNIGSVHVGGLEEAAYADGVITGAYQVKLITLYGHLASVRASNAGAWQWNPHILNRTKVVIDGKDKYVISGATPVAAWGIQGELRTMRTRNVGKGE